MLSAGKVRIAKAEQIHCAIINTTTTTSPVIKNSPDRQSVTLGIQRNRTAKVVV